MTAEAARESSAAHCQLARCHIRSRILRSCHLTAPLSESADVVDAAPGGVYVIEPDRVVGEVPIDQALSGTFEIVNAGDATVRLGEVRKGCSCTNASVADRELLLAGGRR